MDNLQKNKVLKNRGNGSQMSLVFQNNQNNIGNSLDQVQDENQQFREV